MHLRYGDGEDGEAVLFLVEENVSADKASEVNLANTAFAHGSKFSKNGTQLMETMTLHIGDNPNEPFRRLKF